MTTVLDIITSAMRLNQAVRKTESITADEGEDGMATMNEMLASWSNEGLNIISRTWEYFNITSGTSYTIGDGGDLNTVRPTVIKEAFLRIGNIDYSLQPLTDDEYEQIAFKTLATAIPTYYNYDNGYPLGKIRLYSSLAGSAELHLLSEKPFTAYTSLQDTVDLPAGTIRALKYNLAIDLAPEYNKEPSAAVIKGAKESLGAIRLAIAKNRPIKQKYNNNIGMNNIYTGWFR